MIQLIKKSLKVGCNESKGKIFELPADKLEFISGGIIPAGVDPGQEDRIARNRALALAREQERARRIALGLAANLRRQIGGRR